jgi:hypothetical protein
MFLYVSFSIGGEKVKYKENVKKMIDDNENELKELVHQKIDIWSEHVVFSGIWWFGVVLSVLPWLIWLKYRKKDSSNRILFAGYFVMVISLCLDVIGDQLGLWHYRFVVIPFLPTYIPFDITLMPLSVMLLIQIKPKLNPLFKAVVFALLSCYVGEPFFHWLGVYVLDAWRYSYSVPIQILIYLIAHYFSRRENFSHLT